MKKITLALFIIAPVAGILISVIPGTVKHQEYQNQDIMLVAKDRVLSDFDIALIPYGDNLTVYIVEKINGKTADGYMTEGRFFSKEGYYLIEFSEPVKKTTIVHEVSHLMDALMAAHNVHDTEARAYMEAYVYSEIVKKL